MSTVGEIRSSRVRDGDDRSVSIRTIETIIANRQRWSIGVARSAQPGAYANLVGFIAEAAFDHGVRNPGSPRQPDMRPVEWRRCKTIASLICINAFDGHCA